MSNTEIEADFHEIQPQKQIPGNVQDIETEAKKVSDEPVKALAVAPIDIDKKTKALVPKNHSELMAFLRILQKEEVLPKHLKNAHQAMVAWNFAAQLNLPPQPSLRNIAVIHGSPSLFGDLPLSLVQRHKDYMWHEEYCFNKEFKQISFENANLNDEVYGAVFFIMRKGMRSPQSYSFTKADQERAGLIEKAKTGMPWRAYTNVMYIRRARSGGIKAYFSDALCGAGIAEYDYHQGPDLTDLREVGEQEKEGPKTVSDILK